MFEAQQTGNTLMPFSLKSLWEWERYIALNGDRLASDGTSPSFPWRLCNSKDLQDGLIAFGIAGLTTRVFEYDYALSFALLSTAASVIGSEMGRALLTPHIKKAFGDSAFHDKWIDTQPVEGKTPPTSAEDMMISHILADSHHGAYANYPYSSFVLFMLSAPLIFNSKMAESILLPFYFVFLGLGHSLRHYQARFQRVDDLKWVIASRPEKKVTENNPSLALDAV